MPTSSFSYTELSGTTNLYLCGSLPLLYPSEEQFFTWAVSSEELPQPHLTNE